MNAKARLLSTMVISAVCSGAFAAQGDPVNTVSTAPDLTVVQNLIYTDMQPGGQYAGLSEADKESVRNDFAKMQRLLQKDDSIAHMRASAQVEFYNAQEHANGILAGNLHNRYRCTYAVGTGTFFGNLSCATYANLRIQREEMILLSTATPHN
jgi:hypothetical protein